MKKLLCIFASTGLIVGAGATAISCGSKNDSNKSKAILDSIKVYLPEQESNDIFNVVAYINVFLLKNTSFKFGQIAATLAYNNDIKSIMDDQYLIYVSIKGNSKALLELYHAKKMLKKFSLINSKTIETKISNTNKLDFELINKHTDLLPCPKPKPGKDIERYKEEFNDFLITTLGIKNDENLINQYEIKKNPNGDGILKSGDIVIIEAKSNAKFFKGKLEFRVE